MKRVTVNDFQLHQADYLKEIPFILTRRGKPIAIIQSYEDAKKYFKPEDLVE